MTAPIPMPELPERPPREGTDREMLLRFLDYQRGVVLRKMAGLDEEQLRRPMTPSGLTLLGMVKHLAYDERWWFRAVLMGEDVDLPWTDEDPDADWRVEPGETTESIVALYLDEVARSREITRGKRLTSKATRTEPDRDRATLRWILFHMIEEIARHLGHADIMREVIDGATGD